MPKLRPRLKRHRIVAAALQEWLAVGRSTAPADFGAAETAIVRLYERAGYGRPKFVRLSSPQAATMWSNVENLNVTDSEGWCGLLTKTLRYDLMAEIRSELREKVDRRLYNELKWRRNQLGAHFDIQLSHGLRFQLVANTRDEYQRRIQEQIGRRIWGPRWEQVRDFAGSIGEDTRFTGGQDSLWMWLDCGRRVGAIYSPELNDALDDHIAICRSIGWWYPYADTCIMTDRPETIRLDNDGWLHNEPGPALRYRDGCSVWSLHGVRVNRSVVEEPESMTFEEVRYAWEVDERRLMLDRFGGKRGTEALATWMDAGGMSPISREDITHKMQPSGLEAWRRIHGDAPVTCDLYRAELTNDEPLHILKVVCTSTAKVIPLRVPPHVADAAEARAWTFHDRDLAEALET